ncbi:unnamed protein product, partial [Taenia asiatica]|uniref:Abhydro_lipase domain-containing protein n=1 Tax=Taenia asiatica TaxID=60517 RepID=A0A0R3W7S5_TAEAS
KDVYHLTLYCICSSVVFLHHGFLDSAHTWINDLATESLGFILVDAGFSVWLSNSRGSTHSLKHVYLNSSDNKSRAFTWSAMTKRSLTGYSTLPYHAICVNFGRC